MDPLILSLETATKVCSVALHRSNVLIGSFTMHIEKSHSEVLTNMIDRVLFCANATADQLDAIAVSKGPGSYTGLRIGTATAKGLCFALDKPLIAVNTLHSMAAQVNKFNPAGHLLCPMIDARRMEVYCAIYNSKLEEVVETRPEVLTEDSFKDLITSGKVMFFGDGSQKSIPLLGENPNAIYIDSVFPNAESMGVLAAAKFEKQQFEDVAYFEPFYLKEFLVTKPASAK